MTAAEIKDKNGKPISVGSKVYTPIRGGKHEGVVEKIVTTKKEAEQEDVKNPSKVIYTDQHGHKVSHNPETLTVEED